MSAHTKEPWKTVKPGHGLPTKYLCVQIGEDEMYTTLELKKADARRIVSCVNALAGIENPQEALKMAREALGNLLMFCDGLTANPETQWEKAVNAGHKALAALGEQPTATEGGAGVSLFRRTCPKCGRKRGQSHAIDCQMRKFQGSIVGGSADKELNEFRQKVRDSYREWYGKEMP